MSENTTSIRIRVYGPKTIPECVEMLSMFGEMARIDVTQAESSGYVSVTFFDARCGQCALEQMGEAMAELIPAQEQDFRAIVTSLTSLESVTGRPEFGYFGEVADLRKMPSGHLAVEFYDMRAAQRALIGMPGSRPISVKELRTGSPAEYPALMQTPPGLDPQLWKNPTGTLDNQCNDDSSSQDDEKATQANKSQTGGNSPLSPQAIAGTTKPVTPDEFASLELDLDKIARGEDPRTTVMLRRISKSKTQADLVALLGQCGLAGRYTFLYMPYDKRRNSHCRFAFVDFLSPQDVLQLETSLQMFRKLSRVGCGLGVEEQLAVVSYARLQGLQQLLQHFGTAAVMHDKDVSRRPQFMSDCAQQQAFQAAASSPQGPFMKHATASTSNSLDEPIYIPVPVGAISQGMMGA